jgi:hypothetical protein
MSTPAVRDLYFNASGSLVVSLDPHTEIATDEARALSAVCERWAFPTIGADQDFRLVDSFAVTTPIGSETFGERFLYDVNARLAVTTWNEAGKAALVVTDLATDAPIFETCDAELDALFADGSLVGTISDDDPAFRASVIELVTERGLVCGVVAPTVQSIAI